MRSHIGAKFLSLAFPERMSSCGIVAALNDLSKAYGKTSGTKTSTISSATTACRSIQIVINCYNEILPTGTLQCLTRVKSSNNFTSP